MRSIHVIRGDVGPAPADLRAVHVPRWRSLAWWYGGLLVALLGALVGGCAGFAWGLGDWGGVVRFGPSAAVLVGVGLGMLARAEARL